MNAMFARFTSNACACAHSIALICSDEHVTSALWPHKRLIIMLESSSNIKTCFKSVLLNKIYNTLEVRCCCCCCCCFSEIKLCWFYILTLFTPSIVNVYIIYVCLHMIYNAMFLNAHTDRHTRSHQHAYIVFH